jgi:hypothetical protein
VIRPEQLATPRVRAALDKLAAKQAQVDATRAAKQREAERIKLQIVRYWQTAPLP